MTLTQYWPWYRQRLWRVISQKHLWNQHHVRHLDRMADFRESLEPHLGPLWDRTCAIDPDLVTHLPHQVVGIWPQGMDNNGLAVLLPKLDSRQETWCAHQFGFRDRDWLYMGNAVWAFRLKEHATQFQLAWS